MTKRQIEEAAKRRALVKAVRDSFRPHFFARCLEAAYRVIPRCQSCEYNNGERCTVIPITFDGSIKDTDGLCMHWSPSPSAFSSALMYTYGLDSISVQRAAYKACDPDIFEEHRKEYERRGRQSGIDPALLDEQLCLFRAGKVSAVQAAATLGVSPGTFYKKARSARSSEQN